MQLRRAARSDGTLRTVKEVNQRPCEKFNGNPDNPIIRVNQKQTTPKERKMDVKQLAQRGIDMFNDRSFRQKSGELVDAGVVVVDTPTGQELHGVDGYVQYSDGYAKAMPDIKGTVIEHKVTGNKVISRVHGQGTFTGTLQTPQGAVPGNGKKLDIEYQLDQDFNDAGKIVRFAVNYDAKDFARQLGLG